jgi:hypothetical protein
LSNSTEPKATDPLNPTDQKTSSYVKIIFKGLLLISAVGLLYGAKVLYDQSKIPQAIMVTALAIAAIAYVCGLCGLCSRTSTQKPDSNDKSDVEKLKAKNEQTITEEIGEKAQLENQKKIDEENQKKTQEDLEKKIQLENKKKVPKKDEKKVMLEEKKKIELEEKKTIQEEEEQKLTMEITEDFKKLYEKFYTNLHPFDINKDLYNKNSEINKEILEKFTDFISQKFEIISEVLKDTRFNESDKTILKKNKKELSNIIKKIPKTENPLECIQVLQSLNEKILDLKSKWTVLKK